MPAGDKSSRGYDRLGAVYRWLELPLFGHDLQRARVSMLGDLPQCKRALILGDGDGRLLEQFCRIQPDCDVTSIDQSERMLQLQRERVSGQNGQDRVSWIQKDAREHRPEQRIYDLLITAFFLDCFCEADLDRAVPDWLAGVQPGGSYYCVDFTQPNSGWQGLRARFYLKLMHLFFRWQTGLPNRRLVDLGKVLSRQSITLVASQETNHGLIRSMHFRVDGADVEAKTRSERPRGTRQLDRD